MINTNFFRFRILISLSFLVLVLIAILFYNFSNHKPHIVSIKVNCNSNKINFFWKDNQGVVFRNIGNLSNFLNKNSCHLLFAMNGGMFDKNNAPIGLYIENGVELHPLNTKILKSGKGAIPNFYLQPNGVFYINSMNVPKIIPTKDYLYYSSIVFATQSGPMLLINGRINTIFNEFSLNYNIRNGVGILPNNDLIFAVSTNKVNFFEFAKFFKNLGCINALYLDGFVSKMYYPDKNIMQFDGDLGVLIGIFK